MLAGDANPGGAERRGRKEPHRDWGRSLHRAVQLPWETPNHASRPPAGIPGLATHELRSRLAWPGARHPCPKARYGYRETPRASTQRHRRSRRALCAFGWLRRSGRARVTISRGSVARVRSRFGRGSCFPAPVCQPWCPEEMRRCAGTPPTVGWILGTRRFMTSTSRSGMARPAAGTTSGPGRG